MLKIIHTSDWHIGKRLHGQEMYEDHRLFLEWLEAETDRIQPDWLLISGDVFDHANPSTQALKMYYGWLARMSGKQMKIIITGGNHDSPELLQAPSRLLSFMDVHVVGSISSSDGNWIFPLGENLVCAAVPYLRDRDIRLFEEGQLPASRIEAVQQGMIRFFTEAAQRMDAEFPGCSRLAMGHLFAIGAEAGESEREIQVGNLGAFDGSVLEKLFVYSALGHIHRPQQVGNTGKVQYCGSPLPLSFTENHPKQIRLLNWENGEITQEQIPVPVFRQWLRFEGGIDEVREKVHAFKNKAPLAPRAELRIHFPQSDPIQLREVDEWVQEINKSHPEGLQIIHHQVIFDDKQEKREQNPELWAHSDFMQPGKVFEQLLKRADVDEARHAEYLETFGMLLDMYYEEKSGNS